MSHNVAIALSLLIFSFVVTSILIVPFINFLYKLKFQKKDTESLNSLGEKTPIFNKYHRKKVGVPIGGGVLIVAIVSILFMVTLPFLVKMGVDVTSIHKSKSIELATILFTFISFALLGFFDDIKKFFPLKGKIFGLRMRHKLVLESILGIIIGSLLYFGLGISILYIPFIGTLNLGFLYIFFAAFVVVAFTNAVNITDGLDGLAAGSLMISLFGLWLLSGSILDVPLSVFIALWLGALLAFLYFNIYPARLFMGDVGSLAFGATFAVIGLLLGKPIALGVIGFIFVVEILSSLVQMLSKKFYNKKVLPAAPLHLTFQYLGWAEPKIVQRAWIIQIMLTIFGVWLAIL